MMAGREDMVEIRRTELLPVALISKVSMMFMPALLFFQVACSAYGIDYWIGTYCRLLCT